MNEKYSNQQQSTVYVKISVLEEKLEGSINYHPWVFEITWGITVSDFISNYTSFKILKNWIFYTPRLLCIHILKNWISHHRNEVNFDKKTWWRTIVKVCHCPSYKSNFLYTAALLWMVAIWTINILESDWDIFAWVKNSWRLVYF